MEANTTNASEINEINEITTEKPNFSKTDLENMNYIENPLDELNSIQEAKVYFGIPCCGRCCYCCGEDAKITGCCSDYYKYSTLSLKNGKKNYLLKNVVKLDCCGCCCLTKKIDRLNYCKTYSINSAEQFYSKEDGIYVSQMKEEDRACCCCASRKFVVRTMPENSIAGIISYNTCKRKSCFSCKCCGNCLQECCKDYYHCFDILSPEYQIIYRVYFLRCCIKCLERLGYCGTLEFVIKNQNGLTVGKIYANPSCCQLFGLAKADYTYHIIFPKNITLPMKLTLINSTVFFDLITFT